MGFIQEIKQHRFRTWKTFNACLMYVSLGLGASSTGPAMLDLQLQVGATLEEISTILSVRSAGNMLGAFISGLLMLCLDVQLILPFALVGTCASAFLIPYCVHLYYLYVMLFTNGFALGMINNCANIFVIHMWGQESQPFLQLLHFFFGLGSFLAPIVVQPFLLPLEISNQITQHMHPTINQSQSIISDRIFANTTNNNSISVVSVLPVSVQIPELKLRYAYQIIGCFTLATLICLIITLLYKPDNKPHPTRVVQNKLEKLSKNQSINSDEKSCELTEKHVIKQSKDVSISLFHKAELVILGMLFIHLIYGVELSFGNLLPAFAVKSALQFTKSKASFITATYWASFTYFRIFSVALSCWLSNKQMLICSMILISLANAILLPFGTSYELAMWVGTCLMGFGVSPVYPCFLGWYEELFPLSGGITSAINIFSCIAEFVIPVFISSFIETQPMMFLYVIFVYGCISIVVFFMCVLVILQVKAGRKKQEEIVKH